MSAEVPATATPTKPWWQSKTVISAGIAGLAATINYGLQFLPLGDGSLVTGLHEVLDGISVIFSGGAVGGRLVATKVLH